MKTGIISVLAVFIMLGIQMSCAEKLPSRELQRPGRPGVCPEVPKGIFGTCVEECSGDEMCPTGMKCCSNGCGHVCKTPLPQNVKTGVDECPGDLFQKKRSGSK
ncbi:PREDICTED: WAP four-disulfide core domain protein 18-like [Elephantulus edwardii]|uniref:WAP four-disulfide core domain protein 18-like n=1 Tax=Elephantulus edwardii TaxID=28737 RepID=UPI0003F08B91|nr:PREDICTED: WAP four-disulfide core domain protein 18-like [Elephantulus edwardii]